MAVAADYVYRRDPTELMLLRFYEGDFQISRVYAFESGVYLRYAIKCEISHETDREIRPKYENSGQAISNWTYRTIWILRILEIRHYNAKRIIIKTEVILKVLYCV